MLRTACQAAELGHGQHGGSNWLRCSPSGQQASLIVWHTINMAKWDLHKLSPPCLHAYVYTYVQALYSVASLALNDATANKVIYFQPPLNLRLSQELQVQALEHFNSTHERCMYMQSHNDASHPWQQQRPTTHVM